MRIGVACNRFGQSGGMERYALRVVEALVQMGHTPVIFAMSADMSEPICRKSEVHVWSQAINWLPNKWNVVRFNRWLSDMRSKVPVDFLFACCTAVTAEVVACGGTHVGYLKAMQRSPTLFDRWIIDLERTMYAGAELIVAHSAAMKQELERFYGIDPKIVRVIYPPQSFDFSECKEDRTTLRRKFNLPENKTLFLFPSSSHKRKGFDLLCQYFKQTKFSELLVVAGKPLKYPVKNTQYIGFCKDMPSLYRACDYTVMASLYEPLGMVGAESVSCGTPALMGANIGCCEILHSETLKTFDVHSLDDFVNVMTEVRTNPMRLKQPYRQYIDPKGMMTPLEHMALVLSSYK